MREGIGVITYFSLAAGFLSGKYRSEADFGKSPRGARSIPKYMNERGRRILAALDAVVHVDGSRFQPRGIDPPQPRQNLLTRHGALMILEQKHQDAGFSLG